MVITGLQYHRNGCAGAGYYVAHFTWRHKGERYIATAIVFDAPGHVAVTADAGAIGFRCEDFEPELRTFIASPAGQQMAFPHMAVA